MYGRHDGVQSLRRGVQSLRRRRLQSLRRRGVQSLRGFVQSLRGGERLQPVQSLRGVQSLCDELGISLVCCPETPLSLVPPRVGGVLRILTGCGAAKR